MNRKAKQRALARLDALYATLPRLECKGLCYQSCGPIGLTRLEYDRLIDEQKKMTGKTGPVIFDEHRQACSLLTLDNRCALYSARPGICRLFGISQNMACPFGCVPERWLTTEETAAFLQSLANASDPFNAGHSWCFTGTLEQLIKFAPITKDDTPK